MAYARSALTTLNPAIAGEMREREKMDSGKWSLDAVRVGRVELQQHYSAGNPCRHVRSDSQAMLIT